MGTSGSHFSRILKGKCPRCGESALFVDTNPYHLGNMGKMHKSCSHCGLRFEPETGFYYGAMYLSYAIGVFSSLIFFALFNFLLGISTLWSFIAVAVIWIGASPFLFRFSRTLWLSLFTHKHRDI